MSVKLRKTPKSTEQTKISVITETRQILNQCKNSHHQMETLFGHFREVPNLCQGMDFEKKNTYYQFDEKIRDLE